MRWYQKVSLKTYFGVGAAIIFASALILYAMGQIPICKCGYIKLWHGITISSENSQHISDWYTFSHIIHGFGFYFVAWLLGRWRKLPAQAWPLGRMLLFAVAVESAWEIFENTDLIINRYRAVTISRDYYGDAVINSVFDIFAMVLGFFFAARAPVWAIIFATIALEVFVGYSIRDNLALNIIMLIYPLEAIRLWQAGLPANWQAGG